MCVGSSYRAGGPVIQFEVEGKFLNMPIAILVHCPKSDADLNQLYHAVTVNLAK